MALEIRRLSDALGAEVAGIDIRHPLDASDAAAVLDHGLPIIGFIDDGPSPWRRMLGLPIVTVEEAIQLLAPDAVLLSSDSYEQQMWDRCAPLREAGVHVLPLYGTYDRAARLEAGVRS